jgi:uracil-DNA glycosylase
MKENAQNLLSDIKVHLQNEKLAGLPVSWFQGSASEQISLKAQPQVIAMAEPLRESFSNLTLDELRLKALDCKSCRLCETRQNVVFGVGNSRNPLIAFVGEGPGAEEDAQGEPFVGKAGQLLTSAITKGLKMQREDLYICNVVKCRPPENRTPLPDEIMACSRYLFRQLELVNPKIIVALGGPAQQTLTAVSGGITKLRGQWRNLNVSEDSPLRATKVMPTFHPAYILRNPSAKKDFWSDLQMVMLELGL